MNKYKIEVKATKKVISDDLKGLRALKEEKSRFSKIGEWGGIFFAKSLINVLRAFFRD